MLNSPESTAKLPNPYCSELLSLQNGEKQSSLATVDSPVQTVISSSMEELLKLTSAPSSLKSPISTDLGTPEKSQKERTSEVGISPFSSARNIQSGKAAPNGGEAKDTSLQNSPASLFASPKLFPALSASSSAFQYVKATQFDMSCLRRKISCAMHLPQNSPQSAANISPSLKPVVRLTHFSPKHVSTEESLRPVFGHPQIGLDSVQGTYSVIKVENRRMRWKRPEPEGEVEDGKNGETFRCRHCSKCFTTGQALGGHMSRKHSGKSIKYNYKKDVRKRREFERMKLLLAKKKYFESLNFDYGQMVETPKGKLQAKTMINRSRIKKIKSTLTDEEVYNFFDNQ